MLLSKGTFHFILIFIGCFCLLNAEIAFAKQALFVEVELSCEATKDKKHKSFSTTMHGAIQGGSIALTRTWRGRDSRGTGYAPMVGYKKNGKLIIKGTGSFEKSQSSWAYFFSSEGKGSIKALLESGVEGREAQSRKCVLKLLDAVASSDAISALDTIKFLNAKTANLQKELDNAIAEIRDNSSPEKIVKLENKIKLLSDQLASAKSKDDASSREQVDTLRSKITELNAQITSLNKDDAINKKQVNTLKSKITELNAQIASLNKKVSTEQAPSENLIQMATAIASLKDELSSKSALAENLEGQIAGLKREVQTTKDGNISRLENLEAQLSKKDEDIRSLTVALQTLQDMPATQASCPEPVASSETGENNDPIIKYLENKNAELTAKLKNCSAGSVKAKPQKAPVKPQTKKEPSVTNVIFENKWQLSDAVKCSSGSYTVYDKTNGDVFVSNGEKRISPNPTEVKITQLSNNRIKIDKKIFSNDMDKQRNGGRPFVVLSSTEEITVLSEKQILTDKTLKRLNFNRFMSNPSDKVYDTIKEGRKTSSCGLLPGVKNNSQASSSTAPKKKEPKTDPFALPKGKFEAATFCAGVLTYVAEDNFIKQTPALSTKLMSDAMRHVQASGILSQRGIRGENMIAAAMQKLNDTIGPTVEEVEIKRGSPLHGLILKCGSLDALK
jgi:myosin heavy subunit